MNNAVQTSTDPISKWDFRLNMLPVKSKNLLFTLFTLFSLFTLHHSLFAEEDDYQIGGKDVLEVIVYDEPDLSKEAIRVSLDGYVNFPLIGKVNVKGLTSSQIEEKLQNLLADGYILSPQVSVLVMEYGSRKVFVLGAAKNTGSYELRGKTTLLEMISKAGGVGKKAGDHFLVLRETERGPESIPINRKKLIDEGDLSLNVILKNNDTVYIPIADAIYVLGEVKRPGTYELSGNNRTVLSAITHASGFTKIAAPEKTKIIRVNNKGVQETIIVDLEDVMKRGQKSKDIKLKPEDVIIVPQGIF